MSLQTQELTARVVAEVQRLVTGPAGEREMLLALRLLAKWRSARLDAHMDTTGPHQVPHGPFKGMAYSVRAAEGARLARRLGLYEASLAPVIEAIISRAYPLVVDIGAAEGYYAVGLARRMPGSRVLARDGNARALELCAKLAADNGVADQVETGGLLTHADLAICATADCVVICDIEGAEAELLDPEAAPALLQADLLVEVHEGMRPGLVDVLTRRFAGSHAIRRIDRKLDDAPLTGWMGNLSDLDRLLLMWGVAVFGHALALDDPQMTQRHDPARNAAIYFAADGYDPAAKGINGRRVAGESFVRGFLRHAQVDEFVSLTPQTADQTLFARIAGEERSGVPLRPVPLRQAPTMAPVGTLFYPSPNFGAEAWRRAASGQAAWSICGITHTISTKGVMQGFFDLRASPQAEWDAVICTSRAVLSAVLHQMELVDEFLGQRFGGRLPPRPQLPVIPLGVNCDAFTPDPAAGQALRDRLGLGAQDVLFTCIARLTPYEKFDPLPLYIALEAAQRQMPKGQRLALALCGIFRDDYSRRVFEQGAARLMPGVGFHVLDGAKAEDRKAVLSGADAFVFAIDNIQETFGLAPIEAMAAGLPVLVSDWDGLRDTVTPDVGIRIATRTLGPAHAEQESFRHLTGVDSYVQYCAQASAMTEIDMGGLVHAILALARNPDLRARMGAAAARRARAVYDWAQVIPQMQELWHDLSLRRRAALRPEAPLQRAAMPVGPSPFAMFGTYPTVRGGFGPERFRAAPLVKGLTLAETFALRDYAGMGRMVETGETLGRVFEALSAEGEQGADRAGLETRLKLNPLSVDRALIWLLKYGFIRRA